MVIPRWLIFLLAAWVIVFGVYRLWIALGQKRRDPGAAGSRWSEVAVFGRTRRAHAVYGTLYLLLGAMLISSGFGVQMPFASGCRKVLGIGEGGEPIPDGRRLELEPASK